MSAEAERYLPQMTGAHISYEHWHRYLFAARLVAGKAVLDVASGEGYGSRLLAESAASVVGVDVDPGAVRAAAEKYAAPNLAFRCGTAEHIPVEGEHAFDVIVSFETLEHLTADGQARFADEVKRLLKPDGLLVISTPNRPVYTDQSGHQNPYHLCEFDRREFADYLGRHFAHVEMLCQRVYPGSYIWNADRPVPTYTEHQLALTGDGFAPVAGDRKEQLYFIAVCSNAERPALDNSLLIDLDDVAIRGLPGERGFHDAILYADTGDGFGDAAACSRRLPDRGDFEVTYSLGEFGAVRGVRWDPVERRHCRLRIDRVCWRDGSGGEHEIDPAAVVTNGTRDGDTFRFATSDPAVLIPAEGVVESLTVRGWVEVENPDETLPRLDAACRALRAELDRVPHPLTTLYADDGDGFRPELCSSLPTPDGDFEITFDVPEWADVAGLRWDPVEGRFCRLRLDRVTWDDADGTGHDADPADITTNGAHDADGTIRFETTDPQVFLPAAGAVRRVTLRGRLAVEDPADTLSRLEVERGELYAELDRSRAYLQTVLRDTRAEIDQKQAEIDQQTGVIAARDAALAVKDAAIAHRNGVIAARDAALAEKDAALADRDAAIAHKDGVIAHQLGALARQDGLIVQQADAINRLGDEIARLLGLVSTLYADDGGGFRAELSRAVLLPEGGAGPFEVTFPTADFPEVRALRWDPVECRLARVQLDEVLWEDAAGAAHRLDLAAVGCNGTSPVPGWYEFDTLDPALLFPISGGVRSVTVRGRWATDAPMASLAKVHSRLTETADRLAAREEQLREVAAGLGVTVGGAADADPAALRRQVVAVRELAAAHDERTRERDAARAERDAAARRADELEAELRAVLGSRKWRFIWSAAHAAYSVPRFVRSLRRKLRPRLRA